MRDDDPFDSAPPAPTDWAAILNPEQCEAVTAPDGPILVLAAAGTGKTRTLVHRVAYLIERGVAPWHILLLTFTNRAAREMLERANKVATLDLEGIWSGTFHHVCNRILRRHAELAGFTRSFTIMDQDDAHSLVEKCIVEQIPNRKQFPKKDVIAGVISQAANRQRPVAELVEAFGLADVATPEDVAKIAARYRDRKQSENLMDFDDLLVFALRILQEFPDVLAVYQERFEHVLVDEYQDTNGLQAQIVDLLAARHRNIMAVGDDFQCIYSWRGADFRNIMSFPDRWPDCRVVKLERNYRSRPQILSLANACISGNPDQFQKELRPTRPDGPRPEVVYLRDGDEQAVCVVRHINKALDEGFALRDIAILYRSHFHSIELQMTLGRLRVPYVITSGVGVFEQAHAKDMLAFLRVCTGRGDLFSFLRLFQLLPSLGQRTAEKLWEKMEGSFDTSNPAQRLKLKALIPKKALILYEILDGLFEEYWKENLENNGGELVNRFLEAFYADYLRQNYDNAEDREQDVRELGLQIPNSHSIHEFLAEVALMTNIDFTPAGHGNGNDTVHLSTVHQAKGLEWPIVIVLWMAEEMFPSGKALASGDDSEERRLFYVALTRAKDRLTLCVPERRHLKAGGGTLFLKPSRFVKELPRDLTRQRYGL